MPPKLLGKVSLVQAELSGLAKGFADVFERACGQRDYGQFLDVAAAELQQLDPTQFSAKLGRGYAFVCSQLLMTQLCSIPALQFNTMIQDTYGKQLTMMPGHPDEALIEALNSQCLGVQMGHVQHLKELVRNNGTVHFADTLARLSGTEVLPMVAVEAIRAVETHFDELREPNLWNYTASPGYKFVVGSYSLAPKTV